MTALTLWVLPCPLFSIRSGADGNTPLRWSVLIALFVIAATSTLVAAVHGLLRWHRGRQLPGGAVASKENSDEVVAARLASVLDAARILHEEVELLRPMHAELEKLRGNAIEGSEHANGLPGAEPHLVKDSPMGGRLRALSTGRPSAAKVRCGARLAAVNAPFVPPCVAPRLRRRFSDFVSCGCSPPSPRSRRFRTPLSSSPPSRKPPARTNLRTPTMTRATSELLAGRSHAGRTAQRPAGWDAQPLSWLASVLLPRASSLL